MADVRFGIVGYGNIGRAHAATLAGGEVDRARLTAVVTRGDAEVPAGVVRFTSVEDLLAGDLVDAVIVATPTMTHADAGVAVLAAGKHLVIEKPIAMSLATARELVDAVPGGVKAAVMLNQRYHPAYREIKNVVARGELGRIVRFSWLMTAWYRPDVYFLVSRWRGTWPGEGGGALMNQCIHNLDVLQWVLGLPESVMADVRFGKYHSIDVEDEVTAMTTGPDGMSGVVVASTGEAPGMNQLDIVGDRGALHFDGSKLTLHSTDQSVAEHCSTTREMFGMPDYQTREVPVGPDLNQHACVLQNVADAILDDTPLATPLPEGLGSIELANAILLSAWDDRRIDLPLDAERYQSQLDARLSASSLRDPQDIDVHIDMDASYR